MVDAEQLKGLSAEQLHEVTLRLIKDCTEQQSQLEAKDRSIETLTREVTFKTTKVDQLTHELAQYKRLRFGKSSEKLDAAQASLLDETLDADLAAIEEELKQLRPPPKTDNKQQPRRAALPADLPRVDVHHEPESTTCTCGCALKRIGEDVAEKLDYVPGVFTVERHVRGKWACAKCQTLIQAPVPAHVIDKGIPTASLLAQVMVAKYADHLPLYRQEAIFGRAGLAIPRSTLGAWVGACGVRLQPLVDALKDAILAHRVLHADETPVAMLKPGTGKTHRAYLWAYTPGAFEGMKAVVYDFADSRAGQHAQEFLGEWRGALVCDNYSGYKALLAKGIVELHTANKSQIAEAGIQYFARLYEIERKVKDLGSDERQRIRQARGRPIAEALHAWMIAQRLKVPEGSGTAKALNYSLKRWATLTRYLDDGSLPADNNWVENQIRPIAVGRGNWLFAGSLRAGQRAAAVMSLIQSARLNGHDPYLYLRDVLSRLPTCRMSALETLLPHRWRASEAVSVLAGTGARTVASTIA
ncbi:IS66 family transposase [Variovorax sp. V116]|uniref:IS66 family transposase n=1 Tax=Variovorax sp. V116 TaxID=3065953 RepID=UPI0034E873A7